MYFFEQFFKAIFSFIILFNLNLNFFVSAIGRCGVHGNILQIKFVLSGWNVNGHPRFNFATSSLINFNSFNFFNMRLVFHNALFFNDNRLLKRQFLLTDSVLTVSHDHHLMRTFLSLIVQMLFQQSSLTFKGGHSLFYNLYTQPKQFNIDFFDKWLEYY